MKSGIGYALHYMPQAYELEQELTDREIIEIIATKLRRLGYKLHGWVVMEPYPTSCAKCSILTYHTDGQMNKNVTMFFLYDDGEVSMECRPANRQKES